jgi:hypothetical protein
VRRAVAGSLVVHAAVIFAAYRLRTSSVPHPPRTITFEIEHRSRSAEQKAGPVAPALRNSKDRLPSKQRSKLVVQHPEPSGETTPHLPDTANPAPSNPAPPADEVRPRGPIDLKIHTLPTGPESATASTETHTAGSLRSGTSGGRGPWRPRGDAGDPILGKLADTKDEEFPLRRVGSNEYEYSGKAFSAHIAPDGRVSFNNKSIRDFKGLSGGFDVTDLMMRGRHEDPYRFQKEKFMQATEALRTKLAQAALRDRQRASLAALPSHLERIWRAPRPARERRSLLFALWKETLTSDTEMADAAKEARDVIEEFVRERLPARSSDGFTDEELERLNRGSSIKFAPYR